MTVRYGKIGSDLIALSETGVDHDNQKLARRFEYLWLIDEKKTDHLIGMLIKAGCLGVDQWRLVQIRTFFEISDEEFQQAVEKIDIEIRPNGDHFILARHHPESKRLITVRSNSIFFGIIQTLLSTGYRVQSHNSSTIL